MNKTCHAATAAALFCAGTAACAALPVPDVASAQSLGLTGLPEFGCRAVLVVAGSMVPDIDQRVPGIPHRTLTHSALFVAAFLLAGLLFAPLFWVGVGVFLHLIMDSVSPCGVAWAWPLVGYRRYGRKRVKEGVHLVRLYDVTWPSMLLCAGCVCAASAMVVWACWGPFAASVGL